MLAGQIVRVVTTGGGGWGDPLEREPELVQRDVIEGKVSAQAARDDYGVCWSGRGRGSFTIDATATGLRATMKAAARQRPADDRPWPGYE